MELSPTVSEFISRSSERWKHCEGLEETNLLRLAILRDLVRTIHAYKSRSLATGKRGEAQSMKVWEQRIEGLKNRSPLEGDLLTLINGKAEAKKRTRLLPEAIYTRIEKEKFDRYDRAWEVAMASEASSLGWRIWALETWVEVSQVEDWNQKLEEILWPSGIILWIESPSFEGKAPEGQWLGKWLILLHSRFSSPDELQLNFLKWPGFAQNAPHPPKWRLLFSPKKQ